MQQLEASDAEKMSAIERECFTLPWSEEQCRAAFTQKAFAAFGLFCGADLVGYISIYHTGDELEILNLAVRPHIRRLGHGKRILRTTLRLARKMDIHRVLLEVRKGNKAAISLYEGCDFQHVGQRRNYYADTGEDALIYLCELNSCQS
ncbi:ribosomal protein S18-alanine N-acetyltransferase [Desulfovibrio intestinalis]|uniref:[Ribosomal protein bS18]-alanine N-acetyltransferase n=1 Tax=Desulfovibrio intestinalis TaxID=58621 RepID=A0A7W8C223_9BACT|nr:ribosomal protein S18-alanine N-acetyltransferase [Desulfovibrio intestinalis]MBB5143866.1 ribosomal-protein-alanine N-acetyltransferase [Desulfovibrio intestinalis]